MKSLADIIAYNAAHAADALKYGQTQLTASQATDLTDPAQNAAYVTARDNGRTSARAAIDTALTDQQSRGDHHAERHDDRPRRARRLPADRRPGRATRRDTATRSGSRSTARPSARPSCSRSPTPTSRRPSCASRRARPTRACGAACPATRTRSRRGRAPRTRRPTRTPSRRSSPARCRRRSRSRSARRRRSRAFIPGVAQTYTASTTANVISTAGEATLSTSEPGYLTNGAFRLAQPLQVQARSERLERAGLQRPGRDHVPAADRRDGPAADRHLLEDADVHALDHDAVTPLTNLHARADRGRGERSSFPRTSRPGGVHEE